MDVKQKLFLLLVAGFLITAPALAHGSNPVNVSGFGSEIIAAAYTDIVTGADFHLSLNVNVYYQAGVYTYVFTMAHDTNHSDPPPPSGNLSIVTVFNGLYNSSLDWGWVGAVADPFTDDAEFIPSPSPGALTFHLNFPANWDASHSETGPSLVVFAQSDLPPGVDPVDFWFGSGSGGESSFGQTRGPTDAGGGASFAYVPEASSLHLLAFGLLSGVVVGFRKSLWIQNGE